MKFQRAAALFWAPEPWVGVKFDYDPELVQAFKAVPRAWDGDLKTWWVSSTHAPIVETLIAQCGPVKNYTKGSAGRYVSNPYSFLGVMRDAPRELVDAAREIARTRCDGSLTALDDIERAYNRILQDRVELGMIS